MYLHHTTRQKDGKVYRYWRLVRTVRVGRKVVQQTVAHLGELGAAGRAVQVLAVAVALLASCILVGPAYVTRAGFAPGAAAAARVLDREGAPAEVQGRLIV